MSTLDTFASQLRAPDDQAAATALRDLIALGPAATPVLRDALGDRSAHTRRLAAEGLAAVLGIVCWNLAEKREFAALVRASWGDAVVVLATFLIVVFRDLTEGILAGFGIGALLVLHRLAQAVAVDHGGPTDFDDLADRAVRDGYDPALAADPNIVVCRISGAFFFGAAAAVGAALDRIAERPKAYVLDMAGVPLLDSSAARTLEAFVRKAHGQAAAVHVSGASPAVGRVLAAQGIRTPAVAFSATLAEAVTLARQDAGA